jgi:hypothetical protein
MLLDIIILAIVTFFIFLKLNKTIGKIDEDEKLSIQQKIQKQKEQLANILANQTKSCNINNANQSNDSIQKVVGESNTLSAIFPHLSSNSLESLQFIFEKSNIDHHFFLKGAKMTFEIIFFTSPPCAPTPGTRNVISPVIARASAISAGYVPPTTIIKLLFLFHSPFTIFTT